MPIVCTSENGEINVTISDGGINTTIEEVTINSTVDQTVIQNELVAREDISLSVEETQLNFSYTPVVYHTSDWVDINNPIWRDIASGNTEQVDAVSIPPHIAIKWLFTISDLTADLVVCSEILAVRKASELIEPDFVEYAQIGDRKDLDYTVNVTISGDGLRLNVTNDHTATVRTKIRRFGVFS